MAENTALDMLTVLSTRLATQTKSGGAVKLKTFSIELFAMLFMQLFKAWKECKEDDESERSEAEVIIQRAKDKNLRMRIEIAREVKAQGIARGPRKILREAKRIQGEFASAKLEEVEGLLIQLDNR